MSSRGVVFLCEPSQLDRSELDAVRKHTPWRVTSSVLDVRPDDLVIARHYTWPWPRRLDRDLSQIGARPLNNARGYAYCDAPMQWSVDLRGITPQTWEDFSCLPEQGPFFLKGSQADKGRWDRCYAETRADAIALRSELQRDSARRGETIVARRYVSLERLGSGLGGVPPSVEFRVFVLDGAVVSKGFYWPPGDCDLAPPPPADVVPQALLDAAIASIGRWTGMGEHSLRWFVLDVARTAAGEWIVVEVNDGQRAGLSENDPHVLYSAMAQRLESDQ